jgi:flagellar secretion chaperone FliS
VLLFKTAVVRTRTAMKSCEAGQDSVRADAVRKLLNIVIELRSTLDRSIGGEMTENLDQLYDFVITTVVEAHTQRDSEKFQQALNVLDVLRDAFSQAAQQIEKDPKSFEQAKQELEQARSEIDTTLKAQSKPEPQELAVTLPASEEPSVSPTPPPAKRPASVAVKRYSAF